MCGRYSLYESMDFYLRQLRLELVVINGYDMEPINRYNVAPSTRVEVIRPDPAGVRVDKVKWGWAPFWAKGKRPDPINARVETVATSRFFKGIWPHGRVLVPANGWYEWVKDPNDPKKKQPFNIRLRDGGPMFFAGLAEVHVDLEPHEGDGFVIITDASDAGMVDIHDRRPVVLDVESAREWLDPDLPAHRAEEIARRSRAVDEFEWYPVSKLVGNVRNQGMELIVPLENP